MKLKNITKPNVRKYSLGVVKAKAPSAEETAALDNQTFADMSAKGIDVGSQAKKTGLDIGGLATGAAALGSSAIDVATMNDPRPSKGASTAKGAMSGFASTAGIGLNPATLAATGGLSALIPVATGAIGGAIGFFQGKGEEDAYNKQKKAEEDAANLERKQAYDLSSQYNQASAANRGFMGGGKEQSSFYGKDGGRLKMLADGGIHIKPSHKGLFTAKANKAGEGVQEYASHVMANKEDFSPATVKQANFARNASHWKHGDGAIIKKDGGELQPVSKNTQLAVGQSHENGGIKLDSKSEIEGGETLVDKGDHTLVVSDNLVNPLSGNTFAKDDLKLAKSLSKYEGKTSNLAKNSVKQINAKREILHSMQQKMNGDATDEEQTQNMAENGMKLNKVGVAGQGLTSEDITYKADIPIAGRPSPIRYAPKEVKKLNMLSKPVQYPVPLRPQAPNYAENGMKMYKNGGEITDEEIGEMADYEEANKGGKGGGSNWGTNNTTITTREQAIKYYKDNYLPKIKNFPKDLQKRAFQQAVNTGDPYSMSLTAAGIYDEKGIPSKNSGLKDSRSVNRGLSQNENIYNKRLKEINTQYEKDPIAFTKRFDDAVDYHYSNATQKGSQTPLNKAYPNFYEGYTKISRNNNSRDKNYTPSDPANLFGSFGSRPPIQRFKKDDTSVDPSSPDKLPTPYKAPPFTMPDKKKARLAKEEPKDYSSLKSGASSLAKLATYTAPHIMDYANQQKNIARLKGMKFPDAPQQGFVNLAKQDMEVDRADIRKQQANYNAGLSGTLADSQTAALMKANVAEQSANALSRVNQAQRNANIQTANAQTEMNLGIDARNKASKYGQALQQMEKDVDISNRTADTTSNLLSGFRDVQNTYRQEKYADAALDVDLAGMSPEARAEFDRSTKARGHYGRYIVKNGGKLSNLTKSRI